MNKDRQKQTRTLFHLLRATDFFRTFIFAFISDICFLCSTHLWPTFPFHIPWKHPRTTCSPGPPEGINWEHHQPNETIINWPKYDKYPHSIHAPWKHQKTKDPPVFPGGHKTGRSARKGSNDKIKTIENLLQANMKNKMKWKLVQGQISCRLMQGLKINKGKSSRHLIKLILIIMIIIDKKVEFYMVVRLENPCI